MSINKHLITTECSVVIWLFGERVILSLKLIYRCYGRQNLPTCKTLLTQNFGDQRLISQKNLLPDY